MQVASPEGQHILVNSEGKRIREDELIENLRNDKSRVLADDEVGIDPIYVGDLNIYDFAPLETGEFFVRRITQISSPRFPTRTLRKQIGARVMSVTADAVFVIRDGDTFKEGEG